MYIYMCGAHDSLRASFSLLLCKLTGVARRRLRAPTCTFRLRQSSLFLLPQRVRLIRHSDSVLQLCAVFAVIPRRILIYAPDLLRLVLLRELYIYIATNSSSRVFLIFCGASGGIFELFVCLDETLAVVFFVMNIWLNGCGNMAAKF